MIRRRLYRDQQGSFTVESSLVLPIILLATVGMILLGLYIYQQNSNYYIASIASERTAYTWDNSHKNINSGGFSVVSQDGLYWRVFQDHSSGLFSILAPGNGSTTSVELHHGNANTNNNFSLPQKKLLKASEILPPLDKVSLIYSRSLLERTVTIRLEDSLRNPQLLSPWLAVNGYNTEASSRIVDPVEWIRLVDFVQKYVAALAEQFDFGQVKDLLVDPSIGTVPDSFSGHDVDMIPYLQKLVNGKASSFPSEGGTIRQVDALDKSGIVHQGFCTYTRANLIQSQMPKDIYLLQQGKVNGVVWHFFLNCRGKQSKPAKTLVSELQRNGIVVVIHE